ncbi:tetratricopeptide repeat protein [Roseibium sp.]|uniref:tetratricopeptide repeat protein n=1 Tax=Roseibium sp. TaxID=1936156 RepID=UPI003D1325BF
MSDDQTDFDVSDMPAATVENAALAEAYNRGLKLEKAGDLVAAAGSYREALALDPFDPGGFIRCLP